MAIRITSDSTCDLGHLAKERDVAIMPLQVCLDGESFYDGIDIQPTEIFEFVARTKHLPKTSAPSIANYQEFFEKQLELGDAVLHFNLSSKSSASYNSAKQAAEAFGGKVRVVDSLALSSGQGLLVMKAADMRDKGCSIDEIESTVLALRPLVNTSFIPDRLDYLHKGGRVSALTMLGANILKIHPLIYMENGSLVPGKKYRGKMSFLVKQYIEELKVKYPRYDRTRCFITHSCADEDVVAAAKEKTKELFNFDEIVETVAGSIVTSHCGRNTIGLLFIAEE